MERVRRVVVIRGVVQGVGFRPSVHRKALAWGVGGWVRNRSDGVEIQAEGPAPAVEAFLHQVRTDPPPNARIDAFEVGEALPVGASAFTILPSLASEGATLCPPDLATCDACVQELFDPSDRRYRYPFINCTDCGPRFTAVVALPYDRPFTSMACFRMCEACEAEYHDPSNRRYHAQPNACPVCGPRVWLVDRLGNEIPAEDPVAELSRRLRRGSIAALKGIGGFHLATDATNEDAVRRLRARKGRDAKPFAVMVGDLTWARRCARLTDEDLVLLTTPARPILVLDEADGTPLAPGIAPGIGTVGIMLPYSPLHHLLFRDGDEVLPPLVMTSGNLSDEPIARGNREALARLGSCADLFLLHNRDIVARADDSVLQRSAHKTVFIRRSRGFVPTPLDLREEFIPALGTGAFLKATPCLLAGRRAFLGQHVGDLSTRVAVEFHREAIEALCALMRTDPLVVGCDLNPDFPSSRWAQESGRRVERVQHHHAHSVAAALEQGLNLPVVGLAIDGTGLGEDDTIWGCELLWADKTGFRRLGHLLPLPLPGGDAAVREPWRAALGLLWATFGNETWRLLPRLFPSVDPLVLRGVLEATERGLHAPLHSSCGRLFDAAAALAGVCVASRFEAEAPMRLEKEAFQAARRGAEEPYPMPIVEAQTLVMDPRETARALVRDACAGVPAGIIALRFHQAVARGLGRLVALGASRMGVDTVVLSGGCMLNRLLASGLTEELARAGIRPLMPRRLPVGDGAVSLGQAAVAAWRVGLVETRVFP